MPNPTIPTIITLIGGQMTSSHIWRQKTPRQYYDGEEVPHYSFIDAFETLFPSLPRGQDRYQWDNQYQLQQAGIKVANWYGFAVKCSGTEIICACSKSHKQLSIAKEIQHQKTSTLFPNNDGYQKPKRKRESTSDARCPFFIKIGPIWKSGDSKANRHVRITSVFFQHNRVSAGSAYPEKGQKSLPSFYQCSEGLP